MNSIKDTWLTLTGWTNTPRVVTLALSRSSYVRASSLPFYVLTKAHREEPLHLNEPLDIGYSFCFFKSSAHFSLAYRLEVIG
jgi:hypothetical protein